MLKVFKLVPKNHEGYSYGYYELFVIAAESIPEALEIMYKHITFEEIKQNEEIKAYVSKADLSLEAMLPSSTLAMSNFLKRVHRLLPTIIILVINALRDLFLQVSFCFLY